MLTCEFDDCEKETKDLYDVVVRGRVIRACYECYCLVETAQVLEEALLGHHPQGRVQDGHGRLPGDIHPA